jgi:uncharacterized membrane protein
MRLVAFKSFYKEHEGLVWLAILVVPPVVLSAGCLLWPDVFWKGYLYRYLWAPTVADAQDHPVGGIGEGYTLVSTLTYAAVLAVAVFGIWRAFCRLGIRLDSGFLLAMVPWVVLGAVARVLEDAGLFAKGGPLVYLFISPFIYILVGVVAFGLVLSAWAVERRSQLGGVASAMPWAVAILVALDIPPVVVQAAWPGQMAAHAPYLLMPVITAVGAAGLWWRSRATGHVGMRAQVLVAGSVLAAMACAYIALWAWSGPWVPTKEGHATHPMEIPYILAIALACTAAVYALYWALSRRYTQARAFVTPVATVLFLSHFIDGAATYRGLDVYGYGEKHVLPSLLIGLSGTAAVMLLLKFLVVTAVIYLLDVAYREDLERTPSLAWLVKVAVLVLGLAPGIRDALRLAMGV